MKSLLYLLLLFFCIEIAAQRTVHDSLAVLAQAEFEKKDFLQSGQHFLAAFKALGYKGFPDDRLMAAKALAMSGNLDSAFFNLYRLHEKTDFLNYDMLANEPMLGALMADNRWQKLIAELTPTMPELSKKLTLIHTADQEKRKQLDPISKQYGYYSAEYKDLWKTINYLDSLNQISVFAWLDQYGWLGKKEVGNQGCKTVFLVIQHSDLKSQEKYLPLMREAVRENNASRSDFAMLEDRVLLGQGKKQLYGTQQMIDYDTGLRSYRPIEDIDNLNQRRQEMGLPTFTEETIEKIKKEQKE
jgi:hypothetical protein